MRTPPRRHPLLRDPLQRLPGLRVVDLGAPSGRDDRHAREVPAVHHLRTGPRLEQSFGVPVLERAPGPRPAFMDDEPDAAVLHPPHAVVAELSRSSGEGPPASAGEAEGQPASVFDEAPLAAAMPHAEVPVRPGVPVAAEFRRIDGIERRQTGVRGGQGPAREAACRPLRRRRRLEARRRRMQSPAADGLGQKKRPERPVAAPFDRPRPRGFRPARASRARRPMTLRRSPLVVPLLGGMPAGSARRSPRHGRLERPRPPRSGRPASLPCRAFRRRSRRARRSGWPRVRGGGHGARFVAAAAAADSFPRMERDESPARPLRRRRKTRHRIDRPFRSCAAAGESAVSGDSAAEIGRVPTMAGHRGCEFVGRRPIPARLRRKGRRFGARGRPRDRDDEGRIAPEAACVRDGGRRRGPRQPRRQGRDGGRRRHGQKQSGRGRDGERRGPRIVEPARGAAGSQDLVL